jgi:hypothetical protein
MDDQEEAVAQARARANAQEWTTQRIISELGALELFDHRFRRHCESIRDELLPVLREAMRGPASLASLNAGFLLLYLGEPDGTDGVVACLHTLDEPLRRQALVHLSLLPLRPLSPDQPFLIESPVPLKRDLIFAEITGLIDKMDSEIGELALKVTLKLDIPEANQLIPQYLTHSSRKVRTDVLQWLARRHEDRGALAIAEALLFDSNETQDIYWVMSALESYCASNQPELAQRAAGLLARYIRTYGQQPDNTTANLVWRAIGGIAKAQYPEEKQLLETVLNFSTTDWRRGIALERLGEIEGLAGVQRLQLALSEPSLRGFAAKGIAKLMHGQSDSLLVESLTQAAQDETRQEVVRDLVSALIAMSDADAKLVLENLSERLDPLQTMRVYWHLNNLTPRAAIDQFVQAKIIPVPSDEVIDKLEEYWEGDHQPFGFILELLHSQKRISWFDCETSWVQVNYKDLMGTLLDIAKDVFPVEAVSQQVYEESGESDVQFVYNNKAYTIKARYFGDWYDVEAVFYGLNTVLAETNLAERFLLLYTGDQTCIPVFLPELAFRQIAANLRIPLEDKYYSAMNSGVAYEQYVVSKVNKEKT